MELKLNTTALGVAALATAIALSGCAGATDVLEPDKTTPTTESTNTPKPVDSYTLTDGTTVALDPKAPTPPEVVTDLQTKLAPAFAANLTSNGGGGEQAFNAWNKASRLTGKTVILVQRALSGGDMPGDPDKVVWATSSPTSCEPVATKEQALSCAEAFINGRYEKFTILVYNE